MEEVVLGWAGAPTPSTPGRSWAACCTRVVAADPAGEIATPLFLSPLTVKTPVNRILAKLGARDRAQLVVTAYEHGLVSSGAH